MRLLFPLIFILFFHISGAQLRVEPMHWWAGMKDSTLQVLVHGPGIGSTNPAIDHPEVRLTRVHRADSPNYLFLDFVITPRATTGMFVIRFMRDGKLVDSYNYQLYERGRNAGQQEGFNASDVIYLITPDRFANGDTGNDRVAGLREQKVDRADPEGRHGGDIQGIIDHLDYIRDMGFTAIWPTPMLINDMARTSYHGYAITDHYQVDPRMGSLPRYLELSRECQLRGIKLIFDGVANHTGLEYWWKDDLPYRDWINYAGAMRNTNHRRTVNQDPYASLSDSRLMTKGWFVSSMPDLNHDNPFVANYIIQNNIWWIEKLELAGIRQDTYPYSSKSFLSRWSCRILDEYPRFSLVGEEWSLNPLLVAFWQQGKPNSAGYKGCLRSTMDFPLQAALVQALTEPETWNNGLVKLYEGLANDFVYASPKDLLVFGDNHDMDRLFTQLKKDPALLKMALTWILTTRGIPQLYYGTEVLLDNSARPGDHGHIRTDMPGGWKGDTVNAFTGLGLNAAQKEAKSFLKSLLNWRKGRTVIHEGQTRHFAPENGVYVYFRYSSSDTVMVVMNKNVDPARVDLARFSEMLGGKSFAREALTGRKHPLTELSVEGKTALLLEIE
jgi:glycosidase